MSGIFRPGKGRQRADQLVHERGLAESRTRAQALIMAGQVYSGDMRIEKSGQTLASDAPLEVRGAAHPWVSRGGVKLDHALDHFAIDPAGRVALDVGASTGGFTDVLLARARPGSTRSTWATASSTGRSGTTPTWSCWSA